MPLGKAFTGPLVQDLLRRPCPGAGKGFTITGAFLVFSVTLFKDIKRSILGSPNIQYPRPLGALGRSPDWDLSQVSKLWLGPAQMA